MQVRTIKDRAVLTLVRWSCVVAAPRLCLRTYKRSRSFPDPATPTSDFDKFVWRKIFDHNPLFVTACDKLAAKEYALAACPELTTAEVLWRGTDPAQIPANVLAGNVVVKGNHGSRWNIMIRDGQVDLLALRERASSWVRRRYGRSFAEWGYKHARRCIFVERMLLEDGEPIVSEYKFHVAGGKTAYVFATRRNERGKIKKCCFERDGHACPPPDTKDDAWEAMVPPSRFERMRSIAEELARPFDYIRCDLYDLNGTIIFSELTTYPLAGQGGTNLYARGLLNAQWDLRKSWFLTTRQTGWRGLYAAALRRWLDEEAPTPGASPVHQAGRPAVAPPVERN